MKNGRPTRREKHNVLVKGKALEEIVDFFLKLWQQAKPREFAQYIEILKEQKETLIVPSGMSRDGNMAFRGVIPTDLYIVLAHRCPGIWDDPKNVNLVQKLVMGDYRPKAMKVRQYGT